MKKKNSKYKTFNSIKEMGLYFGLTEFEMELMAQKKKIISKLKNARLEQGISQAKLASMVGTKQPAIARMESGIISEVSLDFLAKIAFVLNVSFTLRKAA